MIAKLLITIATLIYGIAPLFADLNSTHVFHPEWTAHSKLHMVWLLVLGLCVVGGFWIAASTQRLYGGALTDSAGIEANILGLEGNAIAFGVVVVLLSIGLFMRSRVIFRKLPK